MITTTQTATKPYLSGVVEGLRLEPVPGCGLLQITINKTYNTFMGREGIFWVGGLGLTCHSDHIIRSHLVLPPRPLLGQVGLARLLRLADPLVLPVKLHQWETLRGHADNLDLVTLSQVEGRRVTLQLGLSRPLIALDQFPGEFGLHPHLELDGVFDGVEL